MTTEAIEGRIVRPNAPPCQFAIVHLSLESVPGGGFDFVDKASPFFPRPYVAAAREGAEAAFRAGTTGGVRVTLVDAEYHEVDSHERDFREAAALAFNKAAALL